MNDRPTLEPPELSVVRDQLAEAMAAPKCHKCGCFHSTVEALSGTEAGRGSLAAVLAKARDTFVLKRYDCLGCAVCFPALASNAFLEAYPSEAEGLDLCPTEEPDARAGWPPLPGDYEVIRYRAPVAVCTLNSEELVGELAARRPEGLSIVGTMHTENLGIERMIKNTLGNPEIRFLLLCGDDTQQAIGHLPGQSLVSLFENGVDDRGRIIGARGKRPILNNVTTEEVNAFVDQVTPVPIIGENDAEKISNAIETCAKGTPGRYLTPYAATAVERVRVDKAGSLVLDKAGFFVVYPDHQNNGLVVEHYTNKNVLDCVLEGRSAGAICSEVIARNLISRLDHAAYLGRELARAEESLRSGTKFVQDAAPGDFPGVSEAQGCATSASTCCPHQSQKGGVLLMKVRWVGLALVALLAAGMLLVKHRSSTVPGSASAPQVILVADLNEAGGEDACAKIIEAVQSARSRKVRTMVLGLDDNPALLGHYHVVTIPTVLFLDPDGNVIQRFEGESAEVVTAIQDRLAKLPGAG
jgi:tetrahydromethanopterin S-methyltransferase subunit A